MAYNLLRELFLIDIEVIVHNALASIHLMKYSTPTTTERRFQTAIWRGPTPCPIISRACVTNQRRMMHALGLEVASAIIWQPSHV